MAVILAGLLAVPASAQAPKAGSGEKYALLVGVREYDPNELRGLPYSEPDVVELAQVLKDAGYRRVVLMTQAEGAKRARLLPLAKNIRAELKGLLQDRDEGDAVVVALVGHGVQFRGGESSYFCPMDAKLSDKSTLIALDEVYRDLQGSGAGVKVLLVDACRNEPQSDNSRSRSVVRLESVTRPQVKKPPGGVAALFSCSEGEKSYEDAELKHGVFCHFLIQGLKGAADLDRDGLVELEELARFAKKRVPDYVKDAFGPEVRQMPVLRGEIRGLPVLVSLARDRAPEVPIPRTVPPAGPPKTLTNSVGMKLVLIPAGEFLMGSDESDKDAYGYERPRHRVRITRPFYLGATEVTQGQYEAVTGKNPSGFKGSAELPVGNVTWNDAIAFCNTLSERENLRPYYHFGAGERSGGEGYRLPTEAEWEYSCRAGSPAPYSFGDDPARLGEFAWFDANSGRKTHPVAQKLANAFGLHDMHGNVSEWCYDGYGERYYDKSPSADPTGPLQATDRVNRGGGWTDGPRRTRSAERGWDTPEVQRRYVYDVVGFRVAHVRSGD